MLRVLLLIEYTIGLRDDMASPHRTNEQAPDDGFYEPQLQLARLYQKRHPRSNNPYLSKVSGIAYGDNVRVPYTINTVVPLGSTVLNILVPGFGSTKSAYVPMAHAMALGGQNAVTIKPARHQGIRTLTPRSLLHPEDLLPEEVSAVMRDIYNKHGIKEFDAEGHSMGGPAAVKAAEMANKQSKGPKVRNVMLIQAAGAS
ncbi:MAG: hypothetical protein JWP13_777, partial [Candidatus Saccharibacteria bacterium]|nr:hypothetical protein [Candidatus Saccharibacteria bacterium]